MKYYATVILKDGRTCVIRNGTQDDGQALLNIFLITHEQTDYLLSYTDECTMTAEQEGKFLQTATDSDNEIELLAEIDGKTVGCAGIEAVGQKYKLKHRAEFGVSVDKAYWGMGIGSALMAACIDCAGKAGYSQLELTAVADNTAGISLYRKFGFEEFGRNPRGFRSRLTGYQELVYMRKEL